MDYPSGWSVIPQVVVQRERWPGVYNARVVPLVQPGQAVRPDQPVLRLLRKEKMEGVDTGRDAGARPPVHASSGESGLQPDRGADIESPGESIPAGLYGQVVGFTKRGGVVIESRAVRVQGTIGAGAQVAGVLTIWQPTWSGEHVRVIPPGAILVVPEPLTLALLHQAVSSGVVGIVSGSIALRDLEGFLRVDVLQLLTSDTVERAQSHLPPLSLCCTEGIGSLRMPSFRLDLLRQYEGSIALLSGITSVRHRHVPELIVSLPITETSETAWQPPDATLLPGVPVRVYAGEYQGVTGHIDYFFTHERTFRSGIHARAVRLRLEDGSFCIVPLHLIEKIW